MIIFYLESRNVSFNTSAAVFILIGVFLAMIGAYIGIMNQLVCRKAQLSKDRIIDALEAKLRQIDSFSSRCQKTNRRILYALSKQDILHQLSEASRIGTSPLETNQYMRIAYGVLMSAVLPAITSFLLGKW